MEIIALRTVKHSDRHSILSAYTAEKGRVALLVPAGPSPAARRTRALLMPLAVAECEVRERPGAELSPLSGVRPLFPAVRTSAQPVRSLLALFLADFFNSLLRESPPDPPLFGFIKQVALTLEQAPAPLLPTLHLNALLRLARFVGIMPDLDTYRPGACLDLRTGTWRLTPPLHPDFLPPESSRLARLLLELPLGSARFPRLSRAARNEALDLLLSYYSLHFSKLTLHSLDILREI